jgi:hypothetical protein
MAQRKKRATIGKRKSKLRGKGRKGSSSTRGKAMKRRKAKPITKIRSKRAAAKKPARGRPGPAKPPRSRTPTVETVSVDVIEEGPSGEINITEFEEVREESEGGPEQPAETPPESEER